MTYRAAILAAFIPVLSSGSGLAQDALSRPQSGSDGFEIPGLRPRRSIELPDPKPVYRYELKPEHGEYLVIVKSFKSPVAADEKGHAKELAENFVEYIRTEHRLYAYVHESGWLQRQERKKEKEQVIAAARKYYSERGLTEEQIEEQVKRHIKMARIPDEYHVFVAPGKGTLKTWEEARDFARYVQKLPPPPAQFCDALVVGTVADISRSRGEPRNPFPLAMPGRNPTLPKKEFTAQQAKADEFLLNLNAGKPHSLIHNTRKPFTLVVKSYGTSQIQRPGAVTAGAGPSQGELLERAAQQAHLVAKILRSLNPPYEAYVLHTRYESFVCVGEYDSKDDPQLLANAEALKGFALRDQKTGEILDRFMDKPLPALIPRP